VLGHPNARRAKLQHRIHDFTTLDKCEARQITILINEQIKDEITNARRLAARMLKQVEIWPPYVVVFV
jgi:hypothetical protein